MPDVTAIAMSENQPKAGPALSATSDAPVIDITQNTADDAQAAAEAAKVAEQAAADAAANDEGGEGETTEARARNDKRVPVGEVTKARAKARDAETRAAALAEQNAALAKSLEALTTKNVEVPADKPRRTDFDDPDAFDAALEGWTDAQIEKARVEAVQQDRAEQQQQSARATQERMAESYRTNVEAFKADHADFDEVFNDTLPISANMAFAIADSEKPADLSYWLGKNPDECARIHALPPIRQIYELGRIEAKLTAPEVKAPTPKPTPIKPVGQRSGTTGKDPAEMSTEEYAAHRNAQLRASP
jgi:hypothetical protein